MLASDVCYVAVGVVWLLVKVRDLTCNTRIALTQLAIVFAFAVFNADIGNETNEIYLRDCGNFSKGVCLPLCVCLEFICNSIKNVYIKGNRGEFFCVQKCYNSIKFIT